MGRKEAKKASKKKVNEAKKLVRKYTEELEKSARRIAEQIRQIPAGQEQKLLFIRRGVVVGSLNVNRNTPMNRILDDWFYNMEDDWVNFLNDNHAHMVLKSSDKIGNTIIKRSQMYKDTETGDCLIEPIREYFKSQSHHKNMKASYNKLVNKRKYDKTDSRPFCELFKDGFPEEHNDLTQEFCDQLNVEIRIFYPFENEAYNVYKPEKSNARTRVFKFRNTRMDHVDHITSQDEPVTITEEEMMKRFDHNVKNKVYMIYSQNNLGLVTYMEELNGVYRVKQDDDVNDFLEETGLNKCNVDFVRDPNLSGFLSSACRFNATIDFKNVEEYAHTCCKECDMTCCEPDEITDFHHIDMAKAYANCHHCSVYRGYPAKITDMRYTNKFMSETGIYHVCSLILNEKLKAINDKMKMYESEGTYTQAELEFLTSCGATYDIVSGAWGSTIDFKFEDYPEMYEKVSYLHYRDYKNGGERKEKIVARYAKVVGQLYSHNTNRWLTMHTSEEHSDAIMNHLSMNEYFWDKEQNKLDVKFPKKSCMFNPQFSAYVTAYQRIMLLEQLITMNLDSVIRVCVDGIYYEGEEVECVNVFRVKNEYLKHNFASESYCSDNNYDYTEFKFDKPMEHYMTKAVIGPGGTGKSFNESNAGYKSPLIVAPSHLLGSAMSKSYDIPYVTYAKLLKEGMKITWKQKEIYQRFSTLIIDEASMISEKMQTIIMHKYPLCKMSFMGDIGYQLPPYDIEGAEFNVERCDFVESYEGVANRRFLDSEIADVCVYLRSAIEKKKRVNDVKKWLREKIQNITKDELRGLYQKEDMILGYYNAENDEYCEMFKDIPKYLVKTKNKKNHVGTILYEDAVGTEFRHSFTTHSVQGRTFENRLFMNLQTMNSLRMIYTAVSRCRRIENLYIIT